MLICVSNSFGLTKCGRAREKQETKRRKIRKPLKKTRNIQTNRKDENPRQRREEEKTKRPVKPLCGKVNLMF